MYILTYTLTNINYFILFYFILKTQCCYFATNLWWNLLIEMVGAAVVLIKKFRDKKFDARFYVILPLENIRALN